ncbi:hypothetical protein BP6252_12297 [Coleophoma cylindrospora]|uniref:C2H2-type domain-containing protein n=1 Tax=Coleophoma cylindrospora TaxID=1849047 RepID=A0A3D8QHM1_9HELO|nr:hypothetical protein BP6252_12297 [Coleophoma cylindrospora]
MPPITREQENTLLRWAVYIKHRPGNSAKAFLKAENGLTGDQIDLWWQITMAEINQGGKFGRDLRASQPAQSGMDVGQNSEPTLQPYEPSVYQSEMAFPEPTDQWPLISSPTGYQAAQEPSKPWPQHSRQTSHPSSHRGHCSVSSTGTGTTSFSSLLFQGSENTASTRSSALSQNSLWSMTRGPNSYSAFNDMDFELFSPEPVDTITGPLWPITDDEWPLARKSQEHDLTLSHLCEPSFSQQKRSASKSHHRRQGSEQALNPSHPQPASSKPTVRYSCTACKKSFNKPYEWRRHEGSSCEPQTDWICMHGNKPDIQTSNGWKCAFCDVSTPDHDTVKGHLEHNHHISKCIAKDVVHRTINRKDKFKDHLKNIHNLAESTSHWESWEHKTAEKFAWGCGFCGKCLYSWDERMKHIAAHYEDEGCDVERWNSDLVIKGLLSQNRAPGFNIESEWRRLSRDVSGTLGWRSDCVEDLKRRLEFRIGDLAGLVTEVRRAAVVVRNEGSRRTGFQEKPLPPPPVEQDDGVMGEVEYEGDDGMVFDTLRPAADIRMHG